MIAGLLATAALAGPVLGDEDGVSLRPGLLLDTVIEARLDDPEVGMRMQRVRPVLRGTLRGDDARYFVQAELAGEVSLLDAVVQLKPREGWRIDAGRFLVPFSRAQSTPVPKLLFHGFSVSTGSVRHGRDVGVQMLTHTKDDRVDVRVGVFPGLLGDADAKHPLAYGRLVVDLVGRVPLDETWNGTDPDAPGGLSLGLGGFGGRDRRAHDDQQLGTEGVGGELVARVGRARLQSEVFARRWADGQTEVGGYGQLSVAPLDRLEVGARFDAWSADESQLTAQGLVAWYVDGNHLRLSLQGSWQRAGAGEPTVGVAVQQQLWF